MGDNATNNDTMIQFIANELTKEGIEYDPMLHRLRYNGHIINLSIQAFLFETHPDALFTGNDENVDFDNEPTKEKLKSW